ncbi:DUF2254 domain-containing protein [Halomonas sp. LR5S13]|uniref:DUF2254 domain-containing protein n=1 Tax=Halomonas rhizosphaerae TaxID=3043296 RepID=UPI0024A9F66D|nr:DUF2254 domain-containing protein [Halomonas rhizosphaerae]MDI5921492.1 DUF2254 domain-containing protein [Halomonas rhizosphaerae]
MIALLHYPLQVTKAFRQSIAYLPSLLALAYFLVGLLAVVPHEGFISMPGWLDFVRFNDKDTLRTLLSTLIAGMISLVVFSFSMVMSVLSQAGGQFSHKLVFGLVTERHHQWVLGNYLGTILFILMLLMVPENGGSPGTWRSLAAYLGVAMVIHCLGLFVYFIHKASQTVQVNSVVAGLHLATSRSLASLKHRQQSPRYMRMADRIPAAAAASCHRFEIRSRQTGFIQNANFAELAKLAASFDGVIHLNFSPGDFTLADFPLLYVDAPAEPDRACADEVLAHLLYGEGESIEDIHVHGLTQLMEMAVKALSPGINDPGTARLCINQLTDLLRRRLEFAPCNAMVDQHNRVRVTWPVESFESLIYRVYTPILHYGQDDVTIGLSLLKSVKSLSLYAQDSDWRLLQAYADRIIGTLADAADHRLDRDFISARLNSGEHRLELPDYLDYHE